MESNLKTNYVLYHANCRDGFGAAYAAWMTHGWHAEYIPCAYGTPPPEVPPGALVWILDFSYPAEVLKRFAQNTTLTVVLDHHESAQRSLADLPPVYRHTNSNLRVHFDMNKSGARLAWEYFHPTKEVPWMIKMIEDRDLWNFQYRDSKPFGAYLNSMPMDFPTWHKIRYAAEGFYVVDKTEEYRMMIAEGNAIIRAMQMDANQMCQRREFAYLTGKDGKQYLAVYANATVNFSEVAHRLLELEPTAQLAIVYGDDVRTGQRIFSLRSRKHEDIHVGEIAEKYGGGGHKHAAGLKIPHSSVLPRMFMRG